MHAAQSTTYDFAFIGLGASNSLILISLIKKGLLKNKRVIIFEAENKSENDKTFCFWAEPNEKIVTALESIISRRFTAIKINAGKPQAIQQQPYHHIRSLDLYKHTLNIITQENISVFRQGIKQVTNTNQSYNVETIDASYIAHYVFDSRAPKADKMGANDIYLNQSFYGLYVKCEQAVFDENTFEMMNFNVDQNKFTQFVYVIPISATEALVELTRFGTELIDKAYATKVLHGFIQTNFGNYHIQGDEVGCIPMTTFRFPTSEQKGVLHTGARGNLIKPSTGYAFKKMFAFAEQVSQQIATNNLTHFNTIALPNKHRFRFYDNLLLLILLYWPAKGKLIFSRLFGQQSVNTIFTFLDEKTNLLQELLIFAFLPKKPFLKALYLYLKENNWLRYIGAFLVVVAYVTISFVSPSWAAYFSYAVLVVGLAWIGIPHGALDHLLSKKPNNSLPLFIGKYLLIIALYFAFWKLFPVMGLLVFILFSSFHFGESEWVQTDKHINNLHSYLKAFLMGLSILLFIIFTHAAESFSVIANYTNLPLIKHAFIGNAIAALSFGYLLYACILSKNASFTGLLFLLLIGVKVPLILAFALYFIFQHSANAWQHLKLRLNMDTRQLYKQSSLYTLGAFFIFVLILFNANEIKDMSALWANFFIFIACISFPHFFMMHMFYKRKLK
jgi:lycopene beta-cyclase